MGEYEALPDYDMFGLRKRDPWQRLAIIDYVIRELYKGKVGLAVIDGIADLILSTNDQEKSSEIANWLMKLSEEENVAIVVIIHKAHSSNKATGHLGSYVQRKAQTVMGIAMDPDNDKRVKVNPEYTRDYPWKAFRFGLNESGLPADEEVLDDIFDFEN
jgi:hypothetical protein